MSPWLVTINAAHISQRASPTLKGVSGGKLPPMRLSVTDPEDTQCAMCRSLASGYSPYVSHMFTKK